MLKSWLEIKFPAFELSSGVIISIFKKKNKNKNSA